MHLFAIGKSASMNTNCNREFDSEDEVVGEPERVFVESYENGHDDDIEEDKADKDDCRSSNQVLKQDDTSKEVKNADGADITGSDKDDVEYEVEKIVGDKQKRGKITHYKIRWKGYNESEDTWETVESLNCSDLIQEYNLVRKSNKTDEAVQKKKRKKKVKKSSVVEEKDYKSPVKATKKVSPARKSTRVVPRVNKSDSARVTNSRRRGNKRRSASDSRGAKKAKVERESSGSEGEEEQEYEVSEILESNYTKHGDWKFLVRWKGYGKSEDSWEPKQNLNCSELIDDFIQLVDDIHAKHRKIGTKKRSSSVAVAIPKVKKTKTKVVKKKLRR